MQQRWFHDPEVSLGSPTNSNQKPHSTQHGSGRNLLTPKENHRIKSKQQHRGPLHAYCRIQES
jgi:hypothetical protein